MSLTKLGQLERGALRVGAMSYRIVVLPHVERIEPALMKRLDAFARSGGALIAVGRLPGRAPGFLATPADHQAVQALSSALFEGAQPAAHFVRDAGDLAATISPMVAADVALTPTTPDIGVVHRRAGDIDIYFVANTSNVPRDVEARFRTSQNGAEWWDHVHGTTATLAVRSRNGVRSLSLHLAPYESGFLVCQGTVPLVDSGDSPHSVPLVHSGAASPHSAAPIAVTLTRMTFGDEASGPARTGSWTTDKARQFYSGVVRYEGTFTAPRGPSAGAVLTFGDGSPVTMTPLKNGTRAWLDSPVREAAVVYVNGRRAGSVWCPPFEVSLDGLLRDGENAVRIDVANLAVNAMAGRPLPDYRLLNQRYGVRFEPQDMDQIRPDPGGIMQPVYVTIRRSERPN